ncbi:MAG: cupredoxin domain-containing protein [Aggregatilineales bacterium]
MLHVHEYERYWMIGVAAVLGVFMAALIAGAVVFGVRVPDKGEIINPNELQNTMFANPGVFDMGNGEYNVVMLAQKWSFNPAEIRIPVGAEVTFHVTSRDITHGFIIERHNVNFELVPGHVAQARMTFNEPGEFRYICHEYCGQFHHAMHGVLIVEDTDSLAQTAD